MAHAVTHSINTQSTKGDGIAGTVIKPLSGKTNNFLSDSGTEYEESKRPRISKANHFGFQTKLTIGRANDKYEQEADRLSDQIMGMSVSVSQNTTPAATNLAIQRKCQNRDDEELQRKAEPGETNSGINTNQVTQSLGSAGKPLEQSTRAFFEPRFGHDFSRVRIYSDGCADVAARSINARAFTLGSSIAFRHGEYSPNSVAGRKLLAHELTHVIQQNSVSKCMIQRQKNDDAEQEHLQTPPDRPYRLLAEHVYKGIYRLGTDEVLVYRALEELRRNDLAIAEFKKVYREYVAEREEEPLSEVPIDILVQDIDEDFSGTELEYAFLLINEPIVDAELTIDSKAPETESEMDAAAKKIWDAVETFWGTDEEAIYAALIPFAQDQTKLGRLRVAYRKVSEGENLEARLLDELSEEELDYAIYLLFPPQRAYEYYLREASDVLSAFIRGGDRMVGRECGRDSYEAFDKERWVQEIPSGEVCGLMLRTGLRPSEAIEALISNLSHWGSGEIFNDPTWRVDCAEWVQIHHLYAALKLLGPIRFDHRFSGSEFWLKNQRSTGLSAQTLYIRKLDTGTTRQKNEVLHTVLNKNGKPVNRPQNTTDFIIDKSKKPISTESVLRSAPVGSRIMWTNGFSQQGDIKAIGGRANEFTNENTIKLGDDLYGAHGFTGRKTFTRTELEQKLIAEAMPPDMSVEKAVEKYIFINQIEFYSTVADEPRQIELTK